MQIVLGGLVIAVVALALPATVVAGVTVRGYSLLIASFAAIGGPFHEWQDFYIGLSAFENVLLYVVLPVAAIRRIWPRQFASVACLGAVYIATVPAVIGGALGLAYYAWLLAAVVVAAGFLGLARLYSHAHAMAGA